MPVLNGDKSRAEVVSAAAGHKSGIRVTNALMKMPVLNKNTLALDRHDPAGPPWVLRINALFDQMLKQKNVSSGGKDDGKKGRKRGGSRRGPGTDGSDGDGRTDLITKTKPKTKKPSLYKVVLLNDDYTPMEFVIDVLERFFNMGREDATRVMLHVHHKGKGICGVFTYEIAETKVTQVTDYARQNQHPLQCTMEKE